MINMVQKKINSIIDYQYNYGLIIKNSSVLSIFALNTS